MMRARRPVHELPLEDVLLWPSSSSAASRRTRSSPPRVRFCLPWWQLVIVVVSMYGIALYFVCKQLFVPNNNNINTTTSIAGGMLQTKQRQRTIPVLTVQQVEQLETMQKEVARKLQVNSVQSCRLLLQLEKHNDTLPFTTTTTTCPKGKKVIYWNPMKRERYVCGHRIEAQDVLELPTECADLTTTTTTTTANSIGSTVFPVTPDRTGHGMPSVDLRFDNMSPLKPFECDISCRTAGGNTARSRKVLAIDGAKDWTIACSMEGLEYYPDLKIKDDAYQSNHFYATTSFASEIPMPYFSFAEYKIQSPPVHFDTAIKGAVFMARNCASKNDREELVQEFINHTATFRMDSLSMCMHNANPDPSWDMQNKKEVMRHYLFYLAFENQNTEDYITEKLWGALEAGVLPVYYGAPNVKDHAPEHSIIDVRDYATTEELIAYLRTVANDRTLYESYHAWRSKPLSDAFLEKYNFVHTHSTCRTCRWAYARMYGLGWDHKTQQLRELHIPRQVCVDQQHNNGMIQRPFREMWSTDDKNIGHDTITTTCTMLSQEIMSHTIDNSHLQRTVRDRDGVIDIYIDRAQDSPVDTIIIIKSTMVMETQLSQDHSRWIKVESNHYRMQDHQSRYTFLLRSSLSSSLTQEPFNVNNNQTPTSVSLEITEKMLPVQLRIIVEDLDTFHKGADQEENFFAQLMKEDFLNPVEAFVL